MNRLASGPKVNNMGFIFTNTGEIFEAFPNRPNDGDKDKRHYPLSMDKYEYTSVYSKESYARKGAIKYFKAKKKELEKILKKLGD